MILGPDWYVNPRPLNGLFFRIAWREDSLALRRRQGQIDRNQEGAVEQATLQTALNGFLEPVVAPSSKFSLSFVISYMRCGQCLGYSVPQS